MNVGPWSGSSQESGAILSIEVAQLAHRYLWLAQPSSTKYSLTALRQPSEQIDGWYTPIVDRSWLHDTGHRKLPNHSQR